MVKYTSRKFQITTAVIILNVGVPVLYKHLEISDSIIISVLGAISLLSAAYFGANVVGKKNGDT